MTCAKQILSLIVAGMILATTPSALWAESAAPSGNASDFLGFITCPDPNTSTAACFDPNAAGTKFSGNLTVVFDKTQTPPNPVGFDCSGLPFINNMYVGLTLAQGTSSAPFTTDYLTGVRPHATGFCYLTEEEEQVKVIIDLIRLKVIPHFYKPCADTNTCPGFRVKSITNFQPTAGDLSSPTSGGFSADVTIAVR